MLKQIFLFIAILALCSFSSVCQASESHEMEIIMSPSGGIISPLQDHQAEREETPTNLEESNADIEPIYIPLHDLLQPVLKNFNEGSTSEDDMPPELIKGCCSKSNRMKCCSEFNIFSRVFWTFTQAGTSTIASVSNYGRRSLIPLAAFGGFDNSVKDDLLLWIAILQAIGETCETIHDYAIAKAIRHQKNLKALEKVYEEEIEKQKTKALAKCIQKTTPKLHIATVAPIRIEEAKALKNLYYPRSDRISTIEKEMKRLTDLTMCEKAYYTASEFFWENTYPFFWFAEVALSLAQLVIVIADVSSDEATSLTLAILLVASEAAQYFCNSMKYYSEQKTFENYKFRKTIEEIGQGIHPEEV